MAWKAITESDILTRMAGAELEAFRTAALGESQCDPIDDAITQVTDIVRGYCASKNTLGPAGTIPDALLGPALDILILNIQSRAGGMIIDPDDQRTDASRRAYDILKQVGTGTFSIDDSTGTGYQSAGGATRVTHHTSRVNRDNLKGF